MKKVKKGVFLVRKELCNKVKIRKIREKRGKKFSEKNVIYFPSPQTRCQVSATV